MTFSLLCHYSVIWCPAFVTELVSLQSEGIEGRCGLSVGLGPSMVGSYMIWSHVITESAADLSAIIVSVSFALNLEPSVPCLTVPQGLSLPYLLLLGLLHSIPHAFFFSGFGTIPGYAQGLLLYGTQDHLRLLGIKTMSPRYKASTLSAMLSLQPLNSFLKFGRVSQLKWELWEMLWGARAGKTIGGRNKDANKKVYEPG